MGLSTGSLEDKACTSSGGGGVCLPTGIYPPPFLPSSSWGVGTALWPDIQAPPTGSLSPGDPGLFRLAKWVCPSQPVGMTPDTLPRMAMAEGECGVHRQFQTRG